MDVEDSFGYSGSSIQTPPNEAGNEGRRKSRGVLWEEDEEEEEEVEEEEEEEL